MPTHSLYVATTGDDDNPGSEQQPFATLERARDAVRKLKAGGQLSRGVTTWLRGGIYERNQAFKLTEADSGTEECPLVYSAFPGEHPRLSGGLQIPADAFHPVSDARVLKRMQVAVRDKVLCADLGVLGISDFGAMGARGFGRTHGSMPMMLFCNGQPMQLARWPHDAYARTGPVPGEKRLAGEGNVFSFRHDRLNNWTAASDPWVYGYWRWDWADEYLPVEAIDGRKQTIKTAPGHQFGITEGRRFCIMNLIEELEQPGEWYLDRKRGLLYFYPPLELHCTHVVVTLLSDALVSIENCSFVSIRGLTLEYGRDRGITVKNSDHIRVEACTLRNLSNTAVQIGEPWKFQDTAATSQAGHHNIVHSCEIFNIGGAGIILSGGDRKSLKPAGNCAVDNHIHNFGQTFRTYQPAIEISGVGNRIAHNDIHDAPHLAVWVAGNDHVIELNRIYRVVLETDDAGAIYAGRNPSERGTVIRHNYLHDIGSGLGHGTAAIYLDDGESGMQIRGNIFHRAGDAGRVGFGAIFIHGGRDSLVEGNIFADCEQAIGIEEWSGDVWKDFVTGRYQDGLIPRRIFGGEIDVRKPPYSDRYPELREVDRENGVNRVRLNLAIRCKRFLSDGKRQSANNHVVPSQYKKGSTPVPVQLKELYNLASEKILGFRPIPIDRIGLSENRQSALNSALAEPVAEACGVPRNAEKEHKPINVKIIHIVAPYRGDSPLAQRQELFLQSVDYADRENVALLALAEGKWHRKGWETRPLSRDARTLGDNSSKPFIRDLFNLALETASPSDWILYTNTDCAVDPQLYQQLLSMGGTVVEYMRKDVEGEPSTLDELFANESKNYHFGIDGLALRAGFWQEIRGHLPDFLIGEPHWDTTYSGILRRIIPVRRDKQGLFHPKHDQVWDVTNPTPGGVHNHNLYIDAVAYGHSSTSIIQDDEDVTDTAIVCASFGDDPVRIHANTEGINRQLQQDLYCDFYLVEAVPEGRESAYPESILSRVNHVPVPASIRCQDLFQKESLMNLGWQTALQRHSYNYFIFTDADIFAERLDWFRKIRDRLQENPALAIQGFRMARDTVDPQLHYSSLASAYVLDHQTDLPLNPGLCWAWHRQVLEMGGGFNAECIECAGDSALVAEYLNWDCFQYDPHLYQFDWFREIERDLPFRVELDCVPIDIMHVHHGYLEDRNYDGLRYAIDGMPPFSEFVERDENGLLCWKNPDCAERALIRERHRMNSRAEVDSLFAELSYPRHERTSRPEQHVPRTKPVFESPDDDFHLRVRLPEQPGSHGQADTGVINLFNPVEVFRQDFPYSWCDGVRRMDDSSHIPINTRHRPFSLVLDGLESATYMIGVLPFQPSWEPFNLTGFSTLHLTVQVPDAMISDVAVVLESKDLDGTESESCQVSLVEKGLESGMCREFAIPLSELDGKEGFQLSLSRLLKIIVKNSFRVELSKIYIE